MTTERGVFPLLGHGLLRFFLVAFLWTWSFWLTAIFLSHGHFVIDPMVMVVIGAHGPLVAAVLFVGKDLHLSIRKFLLAGVAPKLAFGWWLFCIFAPLALAGIAFFIGRTWYDFRPETPLLHQPWLIGGTLLFMFFVGGSVQEEYGWRGYALPVLIRWRGPFAASLMLGLVWTLWHLPLFFVHGLSQAHTPFASFVVLTMALSIWFTWLHLRTGGSMFAALLLHAGINTALNVFPPIDTVNPGVSMVFYWLTALFWLGAILFLIFDRQLFWPSRVSLNSLKRGSSFD